MPRTCCVLGCNSNLRSVGAPSVTTFAFPKDEERRKQWLQCINRVDYVPTNSSAVCIHHFREDFIIREISATREDGFVLVVPRERPKLAENAYPSVFLSKLPNQSPRKRRLNRHSRNTSEEQCMNEAASGKSNIKDKLRFHDSGEQSERNGEGGPLARCGHCGTCHECEGRAHREDAALCRLRPRRRACSSVTKPMPDPPLPATKTMPTATTDDYKRIVHTGGTLFACPECPALFTSCTSVQQHRLLHQQLSSISSTASDPPACTVEGQEGAKASLAVATEEEESDDEDRGGGSSPPIELEREDEEEEGDEEEDEVDVEDPEPLEEEMALLLRVTPASKKRGLKPPKIYTCDVCKDVFPSFQELRVHRRITHKTKPHCCDTCGKCFQRASKLKVHMRVHSKERPYHCETCGARFTQHGNLKIHTRIHSGERPFRCEVCGAAFMQPSHLKVHRRCHTGERPYSCHLCPSAFTQLTSLILHKRRHTGERPFPCANCDLAFNSRGDLKVHMRRHTGERPYRCDVCDATFTTLGTLNVHKRRHAGKRTYLCDVCGVAFITHSELKTHKRRHTGEQPYRCDVCGSAFTQVGSLNTHKKRHKESAVTTAVEETTATAAPAQVPGVVVETLEPLMEQVETAKEALGGDPQPFPSWHNPEPPSPAPILPQTIPWRVEDSSEKSFTAAMMCYTALHTQT